MESPLVTESGLAATLDTLEGAALDECVSRHLVEGGDDRLHLDKHGVNKYFCPPRPLASTVVIRGSCTCSAPTRDGFDAARSTLRALWSGRVTFDNCMRNVSTRLSIALGINVAHQVILHPSGSDAELIPLAIANARSNRMGCAAIVNIVVAAGEVGSGTAPAAGGRHFSKYVPNGGIVENGGLVAGFAPSTEVVQIKPRKSCGGRNENYDSLVRKACDDAALRLGDPFILLHAVDGSKTGMRVPSKKLILELIHRFRQRMLITMDACQCRSEPEELNWFLRHGAVVLVTSSKFYSAPGFCSAVLVPDAEAHELENWPAIAPGLSDYLTAYDVPYAMTRLRAHLPRVKKNVGLLLRWMCGIREMELFAQRGVAVRHAIHVWVIGVRKLVLRRKPLLDLIDGEHQHEDGDNTRLGGVNSVVSIKFLSSSGSRFLDANTLRHVHRWLTVDASQLLPAQATRSDREAAALQCMVGQPVDLGGFGVLRLAIGASMARQIADGKVEVELRKDELILDKMCVLAKYGEDMRIL